MSCISLFCFLSAYACTYVYIYKYYYLFICSIILKYCRYTCLIKYISISIYGSTDPEPELFLCPDGVNRLQGHWHGDGGSVWLLSTDHNQIRVLQLSGKSTHYHFYCTKTLITCQKSHYHFLCHRSYRI